MADKEEVRAAFSSLGEILGGADPDFRRRIPDRTVSAWITDLDVAYSGRLSSGELVDIVEIDPVDRGAAQLRLSLTGDDLLDLLDGRLHFGSGWATGRIKVEARWRDVLELRKFL